MSPRELYCVSFQAKICLPCPSQAQKPAIREQQLCHTLLDRDVDACWPAHQVMHPKGDERQPTEEYNRGRAVLYQSRHLPLLAVFQLLPSFSHTRETGDQSPGVRAALRGAGSPAESRLCHWKPERKPGFLHFFSKCHFH